TTSWRSKRKDIRTYRNIQSTKSGAKPIAEMLSTCAEALYCSVYNRLMRNGDKATKIKLNRKAIIVTYCNAGWSRFLSFFLSERPNSTKVGTSANIRYPGTIRKFSTNFAAAE